jgi:hypothetical protein
MDVGEALGDGAVDRHSERATGGRQDRRLSRGRCRDGDGEQQHGCHHCTEHRLSHDGQHVVRVFLVGRPKAGLLEARECLNGDGHEKIGE